MAKKAAVKAMDEVLIQTFATVLLSLLVGAFRNEAKKAQLRRIMLKIYNAIRSAYAGDQDFE